MNERYEVEAVVGRGAMGVVYRARQLGASQRLVAYKQAASADDALVQRLRREAEVLAALDHPNIIRIYDVIEGDGTPAIVMQYAGGGSLADRLASGPLGAGEAATILIAMADALACAHRGDVLHRDVKPANILFTADGHALLSDFGVARRAGDRPLTLPGSIGPATAEYLDPAVARGAPYDERSDVYALAVVGYEMLTGRRPYDADNPLAVIQAAEAGAAQSLLTLAPEVPADLAAVVETAMSPDPLGRPDSAAEFAAGLRAAVARAPRSQPPTRIFGPRPWQAAAAEPTPAVPWRRAVAAAALMVVVPSLVVGGLRRPQQPAPTPAPPATTEPAPAAAAALPPPRTLPLCAGVAVPAGGKGWTVTTGDLNGTGCRSWIRHRRGVLEVQQPDAELLRLRLGAAGDHILLGDWDCDGTDTAALYASATGTIYEFARWPAPQRSLRSTATRATGILGGTATTTTRGACDEIVVTPPFKT